MRGMKKGLGRPSASVEKMLAQRFSDVNLSVLAEPSERRHSGAAVPQHLPSRLRGAAHKQDAGGIWPDYCYLLPPPGQETSLQGTDSCCN